MTPDRVQLFAIVVAIAQFVLVFELVRSKRMLERYALLWLVSSLVLFVLAAWSQLLELIATSVGIATPSNALFLATFAYVLLLLLHFSIVISRLSAQSAILAQHVGLLERSVVELRQLVGAGTSAPTAPPAEPRDAEHD
ncbi:MAG: DUF2304 domain-containing protein [Patulibacter minatonensis]